MRARDCRNACRPPRRARARSGARAARARRAWRALQKSRSLLRASEVGQKEAERLLQLGTRNDRVDHAVLQQKFRALKALWQAGSERALDHARARKTDQRV